jgi:uncharacterized protein (TIGR03435 family)
LRLQVLALTLLSLSWPVAGWQSTVPLPSFDAASVRPGSHPLTPEGYSWSDVKMEGPGRFRAVNANLDECIRWAYGVRDYQVAEPDWMKSNSITFDIDATAPVDAPAERMRLMLQRLLAERFGVVLRRETKTMPVYAITIGKEGSKLKMLTENGPKAISSSGSQATLRMSSPGTTMARFASALSNNLDRPVIDRTGIDGTFALNIAFARQGASDSDAPSVFSALQALGLRLEAVQAPIDIIKVDRGNQTPTPN